ncbi:hypothetical protein IZ6_19750 [Terrihabitans soli]|uniref:MmgE/PrpD family protein n=1 Tax=Terrihabitans soli TaxID=708113 RepID=A0A6S6QW34_9HYPH|nr:MmgE/PrpD family protein [Terrihabitans soli]BCJ91240.1 hypothetical protein IZ6_19750 [Terrihabitans soli]
MSTESELSPMEALSGYIAAAAATPLPDRVVEKTKFHLLDTIAAIVSGATLLPGQKAIEYAGLLGGKPEATVIGTNIKTSVANAALANGMLAHADETDDSHKASRSHPGCAVVPAALAIAQKNGTSGAALLRGIAVGYDVGARINRALSTQKLYDAGHATHAFAGLFGATTAAGALENLSAQQCRWLMSYAAQQAAGITSWRRDPEHIEKAFCFGGMPARNGVTAATMVAAGFTGVDDVFSGPRNFFMAFGQDPNPSLLSEGLGSRFEIMETTLKKWSVGSPNQAVLDMGQAMQQEHGIAASDVKRISLVMSMKETVVAGQSMPDINGKHLLSLMLLDGTLTFASSHDHERMHDPVVLEFQQKIDLSFDPSVEHRKPVMHIEMNDGRVFTRPAEAVRGTPDNPMTKEDVLTKARDLLTPTLGAAGCEAVIDAVWKLDSAANITSLMATVQSDAPKAKKFGGASS